jgi:cyclic pyranopterin phosphate synthase
MTMWHSTRRTVCRQSTTLLQSDSGCFTSSCTIHVDGQINQIGYLWGNKGHLTSDWSRWGFLSLSQSRSGVASLAARPDRVPSDGKVQSTKIKLWRDSLPSLQDVRRRLKDQTGGLDWRNCVQVSRDAYAKEYRIFGKRGAEYMSFREFLVNRSLVDTHSRRHSYLRISLTEKCNLRCLYCMPEDGVDLTPQQRLLTVDEIERLVRLFALAGVNKVRLTGGEPTIRKDLPDIVSRISSIEGIADVGITSNGLVLSRSLKELKESGLSLVNLSLDTLKPNRFETMTRRKGHNRVLSSIDTALELGFDPVKVNVVVMKGVNDDEIPDFVERTRDAPINVRFIEYMPFDGNVWSTEKLVSYKEMKDIVEDYAMKVSGSKLIRFDDGYGEVAKNYAIPGFKGTVSFVTSMTSAFCGDCNRLRLMADGNLKVCLFGNNEVSLRDAIREGATDEDLLAVISAAVDRKKAAHAGMNILASLKNRPMVKIGG